MVRNLLILLANNNRVPSSDRTLVEVGSLFLHVNQQYTTEPEGEK
ncbi:hypothetical protein HMPREF9374_1971 [Desmospora sp. 8437]|nr:hypothetical protein HMPREF9374_1971 [Desmospora sp. 8437]